LEQNIETFIQLILTIIASKLNRQEKAQLKASKFKTAKFNSEVKRKIKNYQKDLQHLKLKYRNLGVQLEILIKQLWDMLLINSKKMNLEHLLEIIIQKNIMINLKKKEFSNIIHKFKHIILIIK
jgi:hypothetical protein